MASLAEGLLQALQGYFQGQADAELQVQRMKQQAFENALRREQLELQRKGLELQAERLRMTDPARLMEVQQRAAEAALPSQVAAAYASSPTARAIAQQLVPGAAWQAEITPAPLFSPEQMREPLPARQTPLVSVPVTPREGSIFAPRPVPTRPTLTATPPTRPLTAQEIAERPELAKLLAPAVLPAAGSQYVFDPRTGVRYWTPPMTPQEAAEQQRRAREHELRTNAARLQIQQTRQQIEQDKKLFPLKLERLTKELDLLGLREEAQKLENILQEINAQAKKLDLDRLRKTAPLRAATEEATLRAKLTQALTDLEVALDTLEYVREHGTLPPEPPREIIQRYIIEEPPERRHIFEYQGLPERPGEFTMRYEGTAQRAGGGPLQQGPRRPGPSGTTQAQQPAVKGPALVSDEQGNRYARVGTDYVPIPSGVDRYWDPEVPYEPNRCAVTAMTVETGKPWGLGAAKDYINVLPKRGYREITSDDPHDIPPGALLVWEKFPGRNGERYGHMGHALGIINGKLWYVANENGQRVVKPVPVSTFKHLHAFQRTTGRPGAVPQRVVARRATAIKRFDDGTERTAAKIEKGQELVQLGAPYQGWLPVRLRGSNIAGWVPLADVK